MPNWVFNNLTVTGEWSDVDRFFVQAREPHMEFHKKLTVDENGETAFVKEADWIRQPLSFWNFVRPEDEILNEYYGDEDNSLSLEEKLQHKTNHWYDWNIRNWGCKWDASDVHVDDSLNGQISYQFDTPWSPPVEAFQAMVSQFPTLRFTLRSVEEQGWGAEYDGTEGRVLLVSDWDIPETHAESIEHKGWCNCEEYGEDELEYMYDDCPKKVEANG